MFTYNIAQQATGCLTAERSLGVVLQILEAQSGHRAHHSEGESERNVSYWGLLLLQVACAGAGGLALPHPRACSVPDPARESCTLRCLRASGLSAGGCGVLRCRWGAGSAASRQLLWQEATGWAPIASSCRRGCTPRHGEACAAGPSLCEGCKTCWGQPREQEQSSRASSERSQSPVA